jgi:hypothetical protein
LSDHLIGPRGLGLSTAFSTLSSDNRQILAEGVLLGKLVYASVLFSVSVESGMQRAQSLWSWSPDSKHKISLDRVPGKHYILGQSRDGPQCVAVR